MMYEIKDEANGARRGRALLGGVLCALLFCPLMSIAQSGASAQRLFSSPEDGAKALVEAIRANDEPALREMLGRRGVDLIGLRRPSSEPGQRERFLAAYDEASKLEPQGDAKMLLEVGKDAWPFPIPLVKTAGGWRFDTRLGEQEVLVRRIGRNELAAMQVCLAIADAEHEYAAFDWDRNGVLEYAPKFMSTPGKRDGLYWESASGGALSPLGPFVAAAGIDSGVSRVAQSRAPYHGYFYRILKRQGKNAKGGAYPYVVHGKMIGGFAVVAYPARYGYTGVKSFIISHDGELYEKDLGRNTQAVAEKIQEFDPDPSWKRP
jgi:hypothetical protein